MGKAKRRGSDEDEMDWRGFIFLAEEDVGCMADPARCTSVRRAPSTNHAQGHEHALLPRLSLLYLRLLSHE